MFFFETRSKARSFASKKAHYITKDMGSSAPAGRRSCLQQGDCFQQWGVVVLKSKAIAKAA